MYLQYVGIIVLRSFVILILCISRSGYSEEIILENKSGVKILIPRMVNGYSLGMIYLNGKEVEKKLIGGMIAIRDIKKEQNIWLLASEAKKISALKYQFFGKHTIDKSTLNFTLTLELPDSIQLINMTYDFSVDKDLNNYEVCLLLHSHFKYDWKCHMYPWAADSRYIQRDPLNWIGIPSLLLYKSNMSQGMMWGIDPSFDYLNPTSWTKNIGLYFINGQIPAQFRIGGRSLKKEITYHCPMQLVLTDITDPDLLVTDLVQTWMTHNNYQIDELKVRSNDEALSLFINGRKNTSMWYPGQGYRLEMGDPSSAFIYIGEQGLSALFDYMIYELTGESEWRQRAFEQMDFILEGQNHNPEDPLYGYIHTAYSLVDYGPAGKGFNSYDRGSNPGYKIDINIYLGRYMLHLWERVNNHEGINRRDWYNAAINSINWAISQQNNDNGLPQKLSFKPLESSGENDWMGTSQPDHVKYVGPGEKSISSTSTRALPSLWHIYKITNDEKYKQIMENLEQYTLSSFQNKYLFNGHHPDLPPHTLEEGGIWGICEYWLYRYEETADKTYLKHAEANAHLSLTWKCPKQLPWVENPTQLASAEQQYFLQYSVYCYQNRQVECLRKLHEYTGNILYDQLAERITQNIFWTQISEGEFIGATHERIADPWLARDDGDGPGFNSMGTIYVNEQSLDLFLQTVEMYRLGEFICKNKMVVNKSYPDGQVYYSEDIRGKQMTEMQIFPAKGFIHSTVMSWTANDKKWMLQSNSTIQSNIRHKISSLYPASKALVLMNGKEIGMFETNQNGELIFDISGTLSKETILEIVMKD